MNATNLGYYCNGTWKTYMSNTGNFYLSGTGNNGLSWNGSTLSIDGNITARNGTFTGNITSDATISGGFICGATVSGGRLNGGLLTMPNSQGINFFCMNLNGEFWMGPISSMYIMADRDWTCAPSIPYGGRCIGGKIVFWDDSGCFANPSQASAICAINGGINSLTYYCNGVPGDRWIQLTTRCYLSVSVFEGGLIYYACTQGLYVAGDVVAGQSDRRLKNSIMNIPNALCKINQLNGVYFNWNECACVLAQRDTNKREIGFIAQDINKVLPEAVDYAAFDRMHGTSISGQDYLTVKYEKITPLLLEGIKELHCEMEKLKCQINILKSR